MSFLGNKLRRLMNQKKWGFIMFSSWIEIVVLVIALSIDAFVASFVYGSNKVRIPLVSAWIITMLSTGILILFLVMGNIVGAFSHFVFTWNHKISRYFVKIVDSMPKRKTKKMGIFNFWTAIYFNCLC